MLQPIIRQSYAVELILTTIAVGQRYQFQDIPQLRGGTVFVTGIDAYSASGLTISPSQKTIISAAAAPNVVCVFAVGETEDIYQIPYSALISQLNGGLIRMFDSKAINLVKSYCILNSVSGVTAGESLFFNFYYTDAKK